ncbi:penicillin-binding protein, partial [Mesorhizobium sp. M1C.F.Ca.ET.212.01.1.1]|uniref:penicillin-binding transpeptidase domain-containing protein n=1 Tax=Mesorhizobium sp. M1C.F.Ca.ET.212.01.1.1 TaxID=2500527 RepID=UPI00113F81DC
ETNGVVRAIVGGRDYGASQFNRATKALRQAGSSFKPYVYATAMEHGFTPNSIISGGPISWGNWSPHNYNGESAGKLPLIVAMAKSINTVPVRLAKDYL